MENELICLDTSVLIEYFRRSKKERSFLFQLAQQNSKFAISVITELEIISGSDEKQKPFWEEVFQNISILPFDVEANRVAIKIFKNLKRKRKLIDMPDLFIGATAKANNLKLATLNEKHFSRIDDLELLTNTPA